MKPIIAFIDDGINPHAVPPGIGFESYTACKDGVYESTPKNVMSHGTLCYRIFDKNVNCPYHLISIKVLDNTTGTGNHKAFAKALEWCTTKNIDIINMSIGTRQYSDFASVTKQIKNLNKTTIVAACNNQNELTIPACLPQVIGVRHCNEVERGRLYYMHNPYDQIEVMTHSGQIPANSCAAPFVSAYVCNLYAQGIKGTYEVRQKLSALSLADGTYTPPATDYHFYKNLLLQREEVNVPVVALLGDNIFQTTKKLAALIKKMVTKGYRAVGLTQYTETNIEKLLFHLPDPAWIDLYYNFTQPDILFLYMDIKDITTLPNNSKPETILCTPGLKNTAAQYWEHKNILNQHENVHELFKQLCPS
jgi:hypothetical protein